MKFPFAPAYTFSSRWSHGFSVAYWTCGPTGIILPAFTYNGITSSVVSLVISFPPSCFSFVQKSYHSVPAGKYMLVGFVSMKSTAASVFVFFAPSLFHPSSSETFTTASGVYCAWVIGATRIDFPNIYSSLISHTFLSSTKSIIKARIKLDWRLLTSQEVE